MNPVLFMLLLAAPSPATSAGPTLLTCPAGTVQVQGGPGPTLAACVDRTEVTVAQYRVCVVSGACKAPREVSRESCTYAQQGADLHPVTCLLRQEAEDYCRWRGRWLPSVEEWKWVARGEGSDLRTWPWGLAAPYFHACWSGPGQRFRTDANGKEGTCPVGSFPEGDVIPLGATTGISDLAGNVREMAIGADGAVRGMGGSFATVRAEDLQGNAEVELGAVERSVDVGFRCLERPGTVRHRFASVPSGATVFVAGNEVCTTPCEVDLKPGTFTVEYRLREHDTYSSTEPIAAGAGPEASLVNTAARLAAERDQAEESRRAATRAFESGMEVVGAILKESLLRNAFSAQCLQAFGSAGVSQRCGLRLFGLEWNPYDHRLPYGNSLTEVPGLSMSLGLSLPSIGSWLFMSSHEEANVLGGAEPFLLYHLGDQVWTVGARAWLEMWGLRVGLSYEKLSVASASTGTDFFGAFIGAGLTTKSNVDKLKNWLLRDAVAVWVGIGFPRGYSVGARLFGLDAEAWTSLLNPMSPQVRQDGFGLGISPWASKAFKVGFMEAARLEPYAHYEWGTVTVCQPGVDGALSCDRTGTKVPFQGLQFGVRLLEASSPGMRFSLDLGYSLASHDGASGLRLSLTLGGGYSINQYEDR